MRRNLSCLGKIIITPFIFSVVGLILLVLVFYLPTGEMKENVARSSEIFNHEEINYQWDNGYKVTMLDNWSDDAILGMAIRDVNESAPVAAMRVSYIDFEREGNVYPMNLAVSNYANHADGNYSFVSYERYWEGLLIILKPLLLFFDVSDIRMIFFMIETILLLAVMFEIGKDRDVSNHIIPFIAMILMINPYTMLLVTKFGIEYIVMLIAILFEIKLSSFLDKKECNRYIFYSLIGALTNYFGMLSFPLLTIGVPLLMYLWKHNNGKTSLHCIGYVTSWTWGYGVCWIMKWVYATAITGDNVVWNAFHQMFYYHDDNSDHVSFALRLWENILVYVKWPFLFAVLMLISFYIVKFVRNSCAIKPISSDRLVSYAVIFALPFLIIFVLGNGYSYSHRWMTARQLCMAFAAVLSLVEESFIVHRR